MPKLPANLLALEEKLQAIEEQHEVIKLENIRLLHH